MYGFLADLTVAVHVGYVAFVVLGQLAIWLGWALGWKWIRNPYFRTIHLIMMGVVVYEELLDIRCPLTVWEEAFRIRAGQDPSGETFMGRLLHSLIFYSAPPWVFTVGYCGFGSLILLTFAFCRPRPFRQGRSARINDTPAQFH